MIGTIGRRRSGGIGIGRGRGSGNASGMAGGGLSGMGRRRMRIRGGGMFGGIGRSGRRLTLLGVRGVMRYEVMTDWFFLGLFSLGFAFWCWKRFFLFWGRGEKQCCMYV